MAKRGLGAVLSRYPSASAAVLSVGIIGAIIGTSIALMNRRPDRAQDAPAPQLAASEMAPARASETASFVDFYGLRIGELPTLAQCNAVRASSPDGDACYARDTDKRGPLGSEPITVGWRNGGPAFAHWPSFTAWLVAGRVERVVMWTDGLQGQRLAYDALVAKYGPATSIRSTPYQNKLGGRFDGIEAVWQKGGVQIEFDGLDNSLDRGEIRITSDTYLTEMKRVPAVSSSRPKM